MGTWQLLEYQDCSGCAKPTGYSTTSRSSSCRSYRTRLTPSRWWLATLGGHSARRCVPLLWVILVAQRRVASSALPAASGGRAPQFLLCSVMQATTIMADLPLSPATEIGSVRRSARTRLVNVNET